jgi:hypothetical protein
LGLNTPRVRRKLRRRYALPEHSKFVAVSFER